MDWRCAEHPHTARQTAKPCLKGAEAAAPTSESDTAWPAKAVPTQSTCVWRSDGCYQAGPKRQSGARTFDLLAAFLDRRDRLEPKAELIWPGLVVE